MQMILQNTQEMKIMMTQQLRQSIELLQLCTYDLEQFIREQALENPLIELKENVEFLDTKKNLSRTNNTDKSNNNLLNNLTREDYDFRSQLFESIKLNFKDTKTKRILKNIIFNLDDNGYCINPTEFMPLDDYEYGLNILQEVGPSGIGARDLKECLRLQAKRSAYCNDYVLEIIDHYLEQLANKKWIEITQKMQIKIQQVQEIYNFIRTLNPKPGAPLHNTKFDYVTPDIVVEEKDGTIVFSLNDRYLPKIELNSFYLSLSGHSKEVKNYFSNLYANYKWLMSSIERRKETIIKIMNVIIQKQQSFFYNGIDAIQPLTLKEVAEEIDMHESTVSRATNNKIIQTPIGTFDLRILFNSKLEKDNGDAISKMQVVHLLKEFIKNENKLKPLSDQKLAEYFEKEKGIIISRRTITKYREELNIPSSNKRKEFM